MVQITKSMSQDHHLRLMLSRIPEPVLKTLSQDELLDRLAHAQDLSRQAVDPSIPADLRKAHKLRAQAVLSARPRTEVEREHTALIAKAATTEGPRQAGAIRRKARDLIEIEHPPAPRRNATAPVAKASGSGARNRVAATSAKTPLRAVFDHRRRLVGVVSPAKILRNNVRKAAGSDTPLQPVYDQQGQLVGVVDPAEVQPVSGAGEPGKGDTTPASKPAGGQQAAQPGEDQVAKAMLEGWRAAARAAKNAKPRTSQKRR